jgi:DNA-binding LacI/PurR family transcriptional regulator
VRRQSAIVSERSVTALSDVLLGKERDEVSASIRDVAQAAGVSITTVSHVLSGQGRVAAETRRRVEQVALDLDYRPNVHAQQLVTRRSRTIAIQVASFTEPNMSTGLIPHSDYFLDLLNGASEAAAESGYALILTPPNVDISKINEFALDGAIMVDPRGDEPLFESQWHRRHPVVTTGRTTKGEPIRALVDNDHRTAALTMLNHLEQQGYERPALVMTNSSRSYIVDVLDAYRTWGARRGIEEVVVEVGEQPSRESAAAALRSLLERAQRPDAVYATSEELALGVLGEAERSGLAVPEDLGICSAVDSTVLQLTRPQITGTFLDPHEIGVRAVRLLLDLAAGREPKTHEPKIETRLHARASTLRRAS